MAKRWVYFFGNGQAEGDPERKDVLGGKGASLAAMSRAGLPVPPGFTIATECCRLFLDADGQWPEGLKQQVSDHVERLELAAGRRFGDGERPLLVSVRSGAAVSMPGMMDTILNCGLSPEMARRQGDPSAFWNVYSQFVLMFARTVAGIPAEAFTAVGEQFRRTVPHHGPPTPDQLADLNQRYRRLYAERAGRDFPTDPWQALVECIEAVFRSWNNDRAVTYRREHDVRGCEGTAVNVQSMFASEVSGIVFTTNPNNLGAEEMIVESSYGLGEAVVSGDVHPDNFVVDRASRAVKGRQIGRKTAVVAALGDVTAHDPDAPSLTDEEIAELAEMSLKVEDFFGYPVDIEWGRADGRFALLQARAIRGLEVAEDVEVGRMEEVHRLREIAGNERKVWVVHNLGETLPAPTPLTWDIVREYMSGDGGFGRMLREFGYEPSERVRRDGFLELICGRVYADPDRAAGLFFDDAIPLTYDRDELARDPSLIDAAPARFEPEKADARFLVKIPGFVAGLIRSKRTMKRIRRRCVEHLEREVMPGYLEWVREKRRQDLTGLSVGEVLAELDARRRYVLDEFAPASLKPGYFGGEAQAGLEKVLVRALGPQAGRQLVLTLTQGLEGDTTVEQNVWLFRLARGEASLDGFLERFGHRAAEEMELSRPRWREDPKAVRQLLVPYADESVPSPEVRHEENAARRRQAEEALPETLAEWGASSFLEEVRFELADARKMLPYRETGKDYLMMGYETIRLAILELARRWDLGRDVFFLRRDELDDYEGNADTLRRRIAGRKVRWASRKQLDLPPVVDSRDLHDLGLPRQYEAAEEFAGTPIAPGVSTGTARIVRDPTRPGHLADDYVLVCHSTDPGWTALFVNARGLVVEQGGVLSHGAIVARDFGIPAVACRDATRRIADGAAVRVDGNRGVITLIEE